MTTRFVYIFGWRGSHSHCTLSNELNPVNDLPPPPTPGLALQQEPLKESTKKPLKTTLSLSSFTNSQNANKHGVTPDFGSCMIYLFFLFKANVSNKQSSTMNSTMIVENVLLHTRRLRQLCMRRRSLHRSAFNFVAVM